MSGHPFCPRKWLRRQRDCRVARPYDVTKSVSSELLPRGTSSYNTSYLAVPLAIRYERGNNAYEYNKNSIHVVLEYYSNIKQKYSIFSRIQFVCHVDIYGSHHPSYTAVLL
jgi:hypothetical protein